jgi:murein DD-endopeptidase MepM/ murein hydrolase activator NlpD
MKRSTAHHRPIEMPISMRLLALLLAASLTGGCSNWANQYGTAPEKVDRGENTMEVVLPPNAPAIWQHYRPLSGNKDQKDVGNEHLGIDILATVGTPVIAPAGGRVVGSYFEPLYGNHIVIDHGREEAGLRVHTRFLHLQERLVDKGETVARGQQIGTVGRTGVLAGLIPHLHFELAREIDSGRVEAMDPNIYWMGGVGVVTCIDKTAEWPDEPFRTVYPVICRDVEWR